jgi:hypothetical protein
MKGKSVEIVIKEYEALWNYYNKSIEERFRLFDWYFKIVALPASIFIAILTLNGKDDISQRITKYYPLACSIFFVIFLCGASLYITYIKQSYKAGKYFESILKVRSWLLVAFPDLYPVFSNKRESEGNRSLLFDSVKFWRGATFVWFNSFLISCCCFLLVYNHSAEWVGWISSFSVFLVSVYLHFRHYKKVFYESSKSSTLFFLKKAWTETSKSGDRE